MDTDTFNPDIDSRTPDLVKRMAGLPIGEAAARLAVEVFTLEKRMAALLALPDREAPFYAAQGAPPVVAGQHGRPASEAAALFASELKALHSDLRVLRRALTRAGAEGSGGTPGSVIRAAAYLLVENRRPGPTPGVRFVMKLAFAHAVQRIGTFFGADLPPPIELPHSILELVTVLETWQEANLEAESASWTVGNTGVARYQQGKAHACKHAADLTKKLGKAGYELVRLG